MPKAAFGNSIGDRQMLEYKKAGGGAPTGAARRCGLKRQRLQTVSHFGSGR